MTLTTKRTVFDIVYCEFCENILLIIMLAVGDQSHGENESIFNDLFGTIMMQLSFQYIPKERDLEKGTHQRKKIGD